MSRWSQQIADGAVLLTVNQRLARHHQSRFSEWQLQRSLVWWESPSIFPLNAWLVSVHAQALAEGLLDKSLIPELLAHQAWQQCIDQDSQVALLDSALATDMARQSWQLSQSWLCFNQDDDYLTRDQYTWQRWMRRYCQWLEDQQCIDKELLPSVLADAFSQAELAPAMRELLPQRLIFDGFLQLTPQIKRLIAVIRALGVSVELSQRQPAAAVHYMCCSDDDAELLLIAAQMRKELEHNPRQLLGLVVPDLHQRRGAVLRAFDRVFFPASSPDEIRAITRPYDISLGLPLSEQPVVVSALLQLKLCFDQLHGADISTLLLSPYWAGSEAESGQREQLDKRLRENRVTSVNITELRSHLRSDSVLHRAMGKLLKQTTPALATLTQWGGSFSATLRALGWPTDSVDTEEYQAVSMWFECFDDLQILDDGKRVSAVFALSQLKSLARKRLFQLDTAETPIQIMGRLESHGITFDCLWLAGLDADQWPPAGSPSPFLSIAQQKNCGIAQSSATTRLELAEAEFQLWASTTPLIVVSSVTERGGNALTPAALPLITASADNAALAEPRLTRLESVDNLVNPALAISRALQLDKTPDDHGPSLDVGSAVHGGARLFENQALCPFKAFALHRLRVRPLEESGLGLDARQHGTLLHEALELFWESVKSHDALVALSEQQLSDQLSIVISEAIERVDVPARLRGIEKQRLMRLMREWLLACEMPRAAFVVENLEQKLQIEHGGIVMNVILDRVDRVGDSLAVIDYKTGVNNKVSTWADQRISNPQLPLYVLTNDDIHAASFAQVASNQCKFIGVASDNDTLPKVGSALSRSTKRDNDESGAAQPLTNWREWRDHWQTSLDAIASEVRAGVATVTPMKTACQFCELKSLCRITDHDVSNDQGDENPTAYPVADGEA